ncbi:MAG: hypothetical protein J6Y88_00240 [Bacteroidales bacterium]|nr:hypothetical protein [Bacteroidales bacterium]
MKKIILILFILNSQLSIFNSLWAQEIGVEYDENGRVISSSHRVVDANDRLAVLITYTYDSVGVVETRTLQSYDKQGRPLRKEVYSVDEYLLYTEENKYDSHGNRTRCTQTTYDEDGKPSETIYKYRYSKQPDGSWQLVSIRLNGKEVLLEE